MICRLLARLRGPAASAATSDAALTRLTDADGRPNVNALWRALKDLEAVRLNMKMLGYELANSLESSRLQAIPVDQPRTVGLESKPTTQADIETRWVRSWCEQLRERPRYHRALWEYAFVLQALHEAGVGEPGRRALGIDAGRQPLASYLARLGVGVAVTGEAPAAFRDDLVGEAAFRRLVRADPVDPAAAGEDFDVVWSIGSAGRQGSLAKGQAFIRNAMRFLRPGGVAVHTFDFNFANDQETLDNWTPALFQRRHIEALAEQLRADGHAPARLDFNVGFQPLDRFIDTPPFETDRNTAFDRLWRDGWQAAHLKVNIDGFACTSFGLIVRKAG